MVILVIVIAAQVNALPVVQTLVVEMGNVRRVNASANRGSQVQTAVSVHKELTAIEVSKNLHYYIQVWLNTILKVCVFLFTVDFNCNLYCTCTISETTKGKVKISVETVALQVNKDKGSMQEKAEEVEHTLLQRKEQKKGSEARQTDLKPKVSTSDKGSGKTQPKQESSAKKTTSKGSSSGTKTPSRPTVAQVLLKHDGKKQEEARKSKTVTVTVTASKKALQKTDLKLVKDGTAIKTHPKSDQLKDEPQTNATQSNTKISNGESKIVTVLSKSMGMNKTKAGKGTLEQSTLPEKNGTQSFGQKHIKKVKLETAADQSVDNRNTEASKTGEERVTQRSQYVVNATVAATSGEARVPQNKTTVHGSGTAKRMGGSGLGSVKVVNISSYSFTITWSAPQGMFKNFTVVRTELHTEGDGVGHEEFEEEAFEADKTTTAKNTTEVQVQGKGTNATAISDKAGGSRGKAETKRISMVIPGNVRSVEFSNLRPNTGYNLQIYGAAAERRSKIHKVTAVTGIFFTGKLPYIISLFQPWL